MDFETAIANYRAALHAFLLSRLGNRDDADDLLQEVFARTLRNLHTLRSADRIKPWLFQIANNALMDHYRRNKREADAMADDLWYGQTEAQSEHAFEPCVETLLRALPDETAEALRAVELGGVSQKDYAARIGVSYSTLKSRVQSGRRQLRALFEQCCDIAFAADGSVLDYRRKPDGCRNC